MSSVMLRYVLFLWVAPLCGVGDPAAVAAPQAPQGAPKVTYVSTDPAVNLLLENARSLVADSGWYHNGTVTATTRNRFLKAIEIASGNASRDAGRTNDMLNEIATQVSTFAREVSDCSSCIDILAQQFKAVTLSFRNRVLALEKKGKK